MKEAWRWQVGSGVGTLPNRVVSWPCRNLTSFSGKTWNESCMDICLLDTWEFTRYSLGEKEREKQRERQVY
jgi:hypothetical protein